MTKEQFVYQLADDLNSGIPTTDTDRFRHQDVALAVSLVYATVLNRLKDSGINTQNLLKPYTVAVDSDGNAVMPVSFIQLSDGFEIAFGEDSDQIEMIYPRKNLMSRKVLNNLPARQSLVTVTPSGKKLKFDNFPAQCTSAVVYVYPMFQDIGWEEDFDFPSSGEEMIREMTKASLRERGARPIDTVNDEV